jgi:acyl-coenzyme A thioesterase PaaI-like protein
MIGYCRPRVINVSDTEVVLSIPLNRRTRNHVGSMYIGAMTVGVDFVTGLTAMTSIKKSKKNIVLIFKDLKSSFIKRAEGETFFTCNHTKEIEAAVKKVVDSKQRVNIEVPIIATVPEKFGNEPVAEFTITLSMKEK